MAAPSETQLQQPPTPVEPPGADTRVRTVAGVVTVVAALLAVGAWFATRPEPAAPDWAGRVLSTPEAKPPIVLTDTDGVRFDLQEETEGQLTLLMFGYANCPDICPISLATLQAALDYLGPDVSNRVRMVFVTADPARDTPEALRTYLSAFNTEFVGLSGAVGEIDEAQRLANVPVAVREEPDADGSYTVGHATQIIAYQADGVGRIAYPFGTRQQDWVRDLPRLLAGETPGP